MIRNFIAKIQNSDEATKKRWLIGLSAAAMILIVGLWVVYFNSAIDKIGKAEEQTPSGTGFWQVFKTGVGKATDFIGK